MEIEDLSYSDIKRLKIFNAILLMELTMDYTDLERLKYLNIILLNEFKKSIQEKKSNVENIDENHDSTVDVDNVKNDEPSKDFISTGSKIREDRIIPSTEIKDSSTHKVDNINIKDIEDDQNLINDYDMNHGEISMDNELIFHLLKMI